MIIYIDEENYNKLFYYFLLFLLIVVIQVSNGNRRVWVLVINHRNLRVY